MVYGLRSFHSQATVLVQSLSHLTGLAPIKALTPNTITSRHHSSAVLQVGMKSCLFVLLALVLLSSSAAARSLAQVCGSFHFAFERPHAACVFPYG